MEWRSKSAITRYLKRKGIETEWAENDNSLLICTDEKGILFVYCFELDDFDKMREVSRRRFERDMKAALMNGWIDTSASIRCAIAEILINEDVLKLGRTLIRYHEHEFRQ